MIATVTLNAALDVTYRLPRVQWHGANRVESVAARAGGKGVNVARVLHALGEDVIACLLLGGATGELVRAGLGMPSLVVPIAGETRRTVSVVDDADATGFWEPGPQVAGSEWRAFLEAFDSLDAEAIVLSGSVPRGVPADAYAQLIARSRAPVILDADGEALRLGAAAGPAIVKINAAELAGLRARPETLVVTRGEAGLEAHTPEGDFAAAPPVRVRGNPTGAGDAVAAALARSFGVPWPERLRDAAALAAAAVAAPLAGSFDAELYSQNR